MRILRKGFYFRLALANVRRSRQTYLPEIIATAVISGVFLLISGLCFSKTLQNHPSGKSSIMVFSMGLFVFAAFAFGFMVYINNFLIARRKREFGLYGILGLEKRHVGRVLVYENLIVMASGLALGVAGALIFGRLLFLVLLRMIHVTPNSSFSIATVAYALTLGLFGGIFLFTTLLNLRQVHVSNPIELMQSERKGEKDAKLIVPIAIVGLVMLVFAYYEAWTITNSSIAIGVFFPLALLVILATHALFSAGSIVVLRALRKNKSYYYKPAHFVTVSGLFQRMRQNARSLATICVLSTMLVVTVSGTLSLYLGQGKMVRGMYPYDAEIKYGDEAPDAEIERCAEWVAGLAAEKNITIEADMSKLRAFEDVETQERWLNNVVRRGYRARLVHGLIQTDHSLVFDMAGETEDCLAFIDAVTAALEEFSLDGVSCSDYYSTIQDGYAVYGGLLFLGAFFGVLFLAMTVLILYFKQITEGIEDAGRFAVLQKVGMDDTQVRDTINRQVLIVFFLPLATTLLHMVFASRMMACMLQTFMLYDWNLVLACIGGTAVVFVLLYFIVYRLTARVYYRIVRR